LAKQRLKEEKPQHKEAFELYLMLPPEQRSLREVARRLKKAPSTIQVWSESFNWQERVEVREAQVQKQFNELQAKNNETLVDMKANFHKVLKALIAEAIQNIKDKKLIIEDVNDLIKVMKLDLELLGDEDRKAQNELNALTEAVRASVQMFGGNAAQWTYDGKDRLEGDDNDDSAKD
jgi:hypothetical protein